MADVPAPSRSGRIFIRGDRADRRMPCRHSPLAPGARPCTAARLATDVRGRSRQTPRSAEMSCITFESLSAEVDGELAELEAAAVRSHLEGCDKCRALRIKLLVIRGAVRDASVVSPASNGLKARLLATARKRRRASALRLGLGLAAAAAVAAFLLPLV